MSEGKTSPRRCGHFPEKTGRAVSNIITKFKDKHADDTFTSRWLDYVTCYNTIVVGVVWYTSYHHFLGESRFLSFQVRLDTQADKVDGNNRQGQRNL